MSHLSIKEKDPVDDELQALGVSVRSFFEKSLVLILYELEIKLYL